MNMRIQQIDDHKIKVYVSNDDMRKMNIDIKHMRPDSPELGRCLFKIIDHIKSMTGFNAKSEKMIIEAMQSTDGMEIILTTTEDNKVFIKKSMIRKDKIKRVIPKKKVYDPVIYEFFDARSFFDALKFADMEYLEKSETYRIKEKYYIVTDKEDIKYRGYFSEFGTRRNNTEYFMDFLKEHAEFIAKERELVDMSREIHNFY